MFMLLMLSSFKGFFFLVFLNLKTSEANQTVILPAQRSHWWTQSLCWVCSTAVVKG